MMNEVWVHKRTQGFYQVVGQKVSVRGLDGLIHCWDTQMFLQEFEVSSSFVGPTKEVSMTAEIEHRGFETCDGVDAAEEQRLAVLTHVKNAVADAERAGFVVTVTQVPRTPFAMRSYDSVVEVRVKR